MKKNTEIIIITVVAVALVALAVWYFGFHKKKAKETDEEGEHKTLTGLLDVSDLNIKDLFGRENTITEPEAIVRTDYGVAPAAAYRLNHDQLPKLYAQLGRPSNAIVNTNKIKR